MPILFITPFITALIGWLTNKLAIYMLFHPRRARKILSLKWQGVIPKRQSEIATKVGDLLEEKVLGEGWLKKELAAVDLSPYLETLARKLVREQLAEKVQQIPLIGSLINDKLISQIEETVVESVLEESQPLLEQIATDMESRFTVKAKVNDSIMNLDLAELERIVYELARKEFKGIELFGGILGFIIGLAQVGLFLLFR